MIEKNKRESNGLFVVTQTIVLNQDFCAEQKKVYTLLVYKPLLLSFTLQR